MKSRLSFEDWTNDEVHAFLLENNFTAFRQLETGEWIGVMRLMFTMSVCMDITPLSPYAYRWCFADAQEAILFFAEAKEFDEVPSVRTSLKGHRYGGREPLLVEHDERGFPKW